MTSPTAAPARTNNLAFSFSEVLTAILRVRSQSQVLADTETFRAQFRRVLQSAMQDARNLGYNSQHIQMAVLVTVGFLDETILNLPGAQVTDWSRRPLQEELFQHHLAGETVFKNLASLLQQQDSIELADILELHALSLELGFKGRYAFGNSGELRQILQLTRDKIARIRGNVPLFPQPAPTPPPERRKTDRLARGLMFSAAGLALLTVLAFAGYEFSLSSGAASLQNSSVVLR